METTLRPLSLGEILDQTAQIYRTRFLVFFGIGVVPAGTVLVFAAAFFAFLAWTGSDIATGAPFGAVAAAWTAFIVGSLLAVPACLGATALGAAAMSHAAARAILGETISIRDSYSAAWKKGWRYVGLYALQILIVGAAPAVALFMVALLAGFIVAFAGGAGAGTGILIGGLWIVLIGGMVGYVIWMLLRLCLAFPASVVEQAGAWNALKRGTSLSKGTRGRIFLLYLLGAALGQLLAIGLMIPTFIILAMLPGLKGPQHSQMLGTVFLFVSYGCSFAVQAFTKPVYGIALTLFYFDQRIRKEGFDIEWMMHKAGLVIPPPAPTEVEPQFVTAPAASEASMPSAQGSGWAAQTVGTVATSVATDFDPAPQAPPAVVGPTEPSAIPHPESGPVDTSSPQESGESE